MRVLGATTAKAVGVTSIRIPSSASLGSFFISDFFSGNCFLYTAKYPARRCAQEDRYADLPIQKRHTNTDQNGDKHEETVRKIQVRC